MATDDFHPAPGSGRRATEIREPGKWSSSATTGMDRRDWSLWWRIGFTGLLATGMAAGTFSAPVVSVLAGFLIEDFALSRTQLGWLVSLYAGIGAVTSPLIGRAVDGLGGRRVLAAMFVASGLGILGISVAPSFGWLIAVAILSGMGWGAGNPSTNQLIAAHIRPGRRGVIIGVKQSGVQMGILIGGSILPSGVLAFGLRPTLLVAGAIPIALSLVALWFLPADRPPRDAAAGTTRYRWTATAGWLAGYSFLMGAGMASASSYLPLYAQQELGFEPAAAGGLVALAGFIGIGARVVWSRRSERVRHFSKPLALIGLLSVVSTIAIHAAAALGGWLLWIGALGVGGAIVAWNPIVMLAVVSGAEAHQAGRASGLVHLGFLAGFAVSPVLFGFSVDATGAYTIGWIGASLLFALGTVLALFWGRSFRNQSQT